MREIKFRAWDKMHENWLDPHSLHFYGDGAVISDQPVIELMQYTGLKDKNGVEIYEGDILSWSPKEGYLPTDVTDKGEVYWMQEDSQFSVGWWVKYGDFDYSIDTLVGQDVEIIGNIYENPDLLT